MVKNNSFFVALTFLCALSIQGCGENRDNLVQQNPPPNPPPNNAVVTGAKITYVNNGNFVGTCPHTFQFSGRITARGAGVVQYHWEDVGSTPLEEGSIRFDSAGSKTVTGEETFSGSGLADVQLRITSPNQFDSNRLRIEATCQ